MFGVCKVIGTRSKHFNSIIFWGFIGVMGVTVSITKLFFFSGYLDIFWVFCSPYQKLCNIHNAYMGHFSKRDFVTFPLSQFYRNIFNFVITECLCVVLDIFFIFFHLRGSKLFIAFLTSSFCVATNKRHKKINKLKGVYLAKLREMK